MFRSTILPLLTGSPWSRADTRYWPRTSTKTPPFMVSLSPRGVFRVARPELPHRALRSVCTPSRDRASKMSRLFPLPSISLRSSWTLHSQPYLHLPPHLHLRPHLHSHSYLQLKTLLPLLLPLPLQPRFRRKSQRVRLLHESRRVVRDQRGRGDS